MRAPRQEQLQLKLQAQTAQMEALAKMVAKMAAVLDKPTAEPQRTGGPVGQSIPTQPGAASAPLAPGFSSSQTVGPVGHGFPQPEAASAPLARGLSLSDPNAQSPFELQLAA